MNNIRKQLEYRKRIEVIKKNIGLSRILGTKPHGSSDCPFCQKKKKWYSWNDKWGVCWSSSCYINRNYKIPGRQTHKRKRFDVIEAFKLKYGISRFEDCISGLEGLIGNNEIDDVIRSIDKRSNLLNKCLSIYQQELLNVSGQIALEYLINRGFNEKFIRDNNIGYASNPYLLREWNISEEELEEIGLFNRDIDREYFSNRVIFPIRDLYGRFVHLQGRYIKEIPNENGEAKWPRYKSTKSINIDSIDSYLLLEEKIPKYIKSSKTLFICEGAPDTYSLSQLGFPAVGIFGLNNLLKNINKFNAFKSLCIIADNDQFSQNHIYYPGQYKSWRVLIPQLIEAQYLLPNTDIYLWMAPKELGKDINDLLKLGVSGGDLKDRIKAESQELVNYCVQSMGKDISNHETLLRLVSVTGKCKESMRKLIGNVDTLDYVIDILKA